MNILDILVSLNAVQDQDIAVELKDPEEGEKIMGTASPLAQKLWFILEEQMKAGRSAAEKMLEQLDNQTLADIEGKIHQNNSKMRQVDILRDLFWQQIREEFSLNGKDSSSIAIRKNWQIVICPPNRIRSTLIIPIGFGGGRDLEDIFGSGFEEFIRSQGRCSDPNCPNCNPKKPN